MGVVTPFTELEGSSPTSSTTRSSDANDSPCTNPPAQQSGDAGVTIEAVFDKESCIQAKAPALAKLLTAILDTQSFAQFLSSRLQASLQKGKSASPPAVDSYSLSTCYCHGRC